MKILFLIFRDINNPSSVGGDYYLWELAKGLHLHGHKISLVCNRFRGSKKEEIIDGIEIFRIKGFLRLPFRIFKIYFSQFRDYDIVIEEAIGGNRIPYFASIYVKKPLVAVWHQKHSRIFYEQFPVPISFMLSLIERFLANIYRKRTIITPSNGAKEKIITLGFPQKSVKVIYDGVDKIFSFPKTDRKRSNTIVCLGKLRKYKRFDHAILAFNKIIENVDCEYKLVIAGKISEFDRKYVFSLFRLVKRLSIGEKVEFKFNISEEEKLDLLERSKILVQPSPVEGFSIVIIEANRCGTPVIASDGVPKDVLIDGFNGIVYPFGDIDKFVKAFFKLNKSDKMWNELSKNSIKWAKKFNWESSTVELLKILESKLIIH